MRFRDLKYTPGAYIRLSLASYSTILRTKLRIEEKIKETGELSRDGKVGTGGLEAIAAGGMHNLAIDESGKVGSSGRVGADPTRSDLGVSMITPPLGVRRLIILILLNRVRPFLPKISRHGL